jgi:hypothetical protein
LREIVERRVIRDFLLEEEVDDMPSILGAALLGSLTLLLLQHR